MLIVACLDWNNYLGRGSEYVARLHASIGRHLRMDHEFCVLTEQDMPSGVDGWWNKVEMFRRGMFSDEPVLYFDLDTVICGDLTEIANAALNAEDQLIMLDDFYHPAKAQSSVMAWTPKYAHHVHDMWVRAGRPQFDPRGDQGWIGQFCNERWQEIVPGQIVSFKADCAQGIPENARVICFHGLPRPHSVAEIMNNWRL